MRHVGHAGHDYARRKFDRCATADAYTATQHAVWADPRTADYPDTAADHRMRANDAVVANLHLIIDLDAVFDDRIVNRTAIDRRTCADFHIRANADSAKLSNFALDAGAISRIAKPIRTDHGRTVHYCARTKPHARIQCHVRPKPDILGNDAVRADVAMRANHRALTNTHARLNNSTGSN